MKYYLLTFIALSFISCAEPMGEKIVKIPEASGISYCSNSDTLIVANDEGSYYEINRKGKILQKVKLGKYDFEGEDIVVICILKGAFLFCSEVTFQANVKTFLITGLGLRSKPNLNKAPTCPNDGVHFFHFVHPATYS